MDIVFICKSKSRPLLMKDTITSDIQGSKVIIKAGNGISPLKGQEVAVSYSLKALPGEKVVDSSLERNSPLKFTLGERESLPVIEKAVLEMTVGEKSTFKLSKKDLYERIAKVSNEFVLEMELLAAVDKKRPLEDITLEEKVKLAEETKAKGNGHFKQKQYKEACGCYREGLGYLDSVMERKRRAEFFPLWSSLQLNLCVCLNSMGQWRESKRGCDRVVKRSKDHSKARYLRGIAEKNMAMFDEALADLEASLAQNPADERIKYEIESTKELKKQAEAKTRKSLEKIFKSESLYSEKESAMLKVPEYDPKNPKVFMEVQIREEKKRIVIELYEKLAPKVVENFKCLCTGEKATEADQLCYKGCKFNKLVKDFMLEGGDIEKGDGTGCKSIYGGRFTDEVNWVDHAVPGLLSTGVDKLNDSKFFIVFKPAPWLNKKHTVFGRIIQGLDFIKDLEKVEVDDKNVPKEPLFIADCGLFTDSIESPDST
eukprot:TRINITY_DN12851_c0_g3_i3.p1 TRINITY_DN12851_c0_g3~~TRINITY_DN12851_c0_g3_i3.p1  ORF type:complete len:485 (+),score=163.83 TRINITY_DN12851_c0_g3_i3:48-1502(+)